MTGHGGLLSGADFILRDVDFRAATALFEAESG